MSRITDGTSNTIMLVEAAEPVEWTRPDVLEFDPNKPLPKLGGLTKGGFNIAMCDGSVRFVKDTIDPIMLKAMLTRQGGEVVAFDP
jgi:prepilin-type processing-associated H-X9-DG protein